MMNLKEKKRPVKSIIMIFVSMSLMLIGCSLQKYAPLDPGKIVHTYKIDYTPERIALLKEYAEAHYGEYYKNSTGMAVWPGVEIEPKIIVVHYTAISTLAETMLVFTPDTLTNRPNLSKSGKANVGVQFIVDQDGTIYQTMPDNYFARHCIGLNHCAIGFENVGMGDITRSGLRGKPQKNMELTLAQVKSNVALIKYLKNKYPDIEILIGHQEYRQLEEKSHPGYKYFHENDQGYRTEKSDPGELFLKAIRKELKKDLKPGSDGQVFK